jgi:outer membrane protein OmpA-like peptidoglycan-associated protein
MRAFKTLLFAATLAVSGTAAADRPSDGPDFQIPQTVRGDVNREMAASSAENELLPVDLIHFGFASAALDVVDVAQVRAAARWLASHPDHALVIEGYADPIGSYAYNHNLADRRAEAVEGVLLAAGVPPRRLVVFVYGESKPLSAARANNRCVRLWATR